MAAGDIKNERAIVMKLTAGVAVAKGEVVAIQGDGKWDPVTDNMKGKFAVAIEAASGANQKFRAVVFGPAEVTATTAAIPKGALVMSGSTGKVTLEDWAVVGETVGMAMEEFASGGAQTIFVGLVR